MGGREIKTREASMRASGVSNLNGEGRSIALVFSFSFSFQELSRRVVKWMPDRFAYVVKSVKVRD